MTSYRPSAPGVCCSPAAKHCMYVQMYTQLKYVFNSEEAGGDETTKSSQKLLLAHTENVCMRTNFCASQNKCD